MPLREEVRALAMARDLEGVRALAGRERRVLSALLPLTYQPEGLVRWRALEALGVAAGRVADRDPEFVRGILRRLLWSLSDESGSIGWSAPEALGEIIASRPQLFAEFAPLVVSLFEMLEEEYFHPGVLWAIGRIASRAPDLVREALAPALAFLSDPRPQVRGMAARCLGNLGLLEATASLQGLITDESPVCLYEEGSLLNTTVGRLAQEASAQLEQ